MRLLGVGIGAAVLTVLMASGTAGIQTAGSVPQELAGKRASLDLRQMDLRAALNLVAEQNGLNIVCGDEVTGEVTGHFDDVPVAEILDALCRACGYRYDAVGDVIVVTRPAEDAARWGETRVIPLHFTDGVRVRAAVTKLLSPRGSIQVFPEMEESADPRVPREGGTEAAVLIVHDERACVDEIASVVSALDRAPKQLMIEVRLVETVLGNDSDVGFEWTAEASVDGNETPQPLPLDRERFTFGTLSLEQFHLVLRTLDEDKNSKLVSHPRITTEDNREARISVGTVVPVRTVSRFSEAGITQDLLTYEDKEINIELSVTPHVTPEGMITLVVEPTVEDIIGWTGEFDDQPITSKRKLATRVTVRDGETIAMGGLIKDSEIESIRRVWLVGRIPLLGRLFTNTVRSKQKTDMLIFITPHVLNP